MLLFNGQDLEHIIGLKTKTLEDTFRLDRLLVYNSVLCELSRKQILQLETFTEVRPIDRGLGYPGREGSGRERQREAERGRERGGGGVTLANSRNRRYRCWLRCR